MINTDLIRPFNDTCNCSYTSTTSGKTAHLSLSALAKLMSDIPEPPRIYAMKLRLLEHKALPKNTIFLSSDLAEAIEEAIG